MASRAKLEMVLVVAPEKRELFVKGDDDPKYPFALLHHPVEETTLLAGPMEEGHWRLLWMTMSSSYPV